MTSIINFLAGKDDTQDQPHDDKPDPLGLCPDSNHPHAIDLGTYGTWSCCNVGASSPLERGSFYAWGETESKDDYTLDTYLYGSTYSEGNPTYDELPTDISGSHLGRRHSISLGRTLLRVCSPSNNEVIQDS